MLNAKPRLERLLPGQARDGAESECGNTSQPDRMRLRGTRRVDQHPQDGVGWAVPNQRLQQARGVAIATRPWVVLRVGQHHGGTGCPKLNSTLHRLIR